MLSSHRGESSQCPDQRTYRVSVGLPVYNGGAFLSQAIQSLLDQEFGDFELIISDNGSTDDTERICREFASKDRRIRFYRHEENKGAAWNYNFVFGRAQGEYFKWAAHDDICLPRFLSSTFEALENAPPDVVLAYPRSRLIDADGAVIGEDRDDMRVNGATPRKRLHRVLATVNMAVPVVGLIKSSALRSTRLIDAFAGSDYVLIAELALIGPFIQVDEVQFLRRTHDSTSRRAARDRLAVLHWFDPKAKLRGPWTDRQRLAIEYARSVRRLVRPLPQRALCLATVPTVMLARRARVIAGRCRRAIVRRLPTPSRR